MKVRAKSSLKLTTGRVNLDYTFVAGTPLSSVVEQLVTDLVFQGGKGAAVELVNNVVASIPDETQESRSAP